MIRQAKVEQETIIKHGNLFINMRCYMVRINNKEIKLSPKEFKTLCLLARHPDWVFTKNEIYEKVYQNEKENDVDNSIFCLIYSLRKKIELDPKRPQYIRTIWGVGYKFVNSE